MSNHEGNLVIWLVVVFLLSKLKIILNKLTWVLLNWTDFSIILFYIIGKKSFTLSTILLIIQMSHLPWLLKTQNNGRSEQEII